MTECHQNWRKEHIDKPEEGGIVWFMAEFEECRLLKGVGEDYISSSEFAYYGTLPK